MSVFVSTIYFFASFILCPTFATPKYQRVYVGTKVIEVIDATKHGFRIAIRESFVKDYLSPSQIPTLFISAIPFSEDEIPMSKVLYPDSVVEDKQAGHFHSLLLIRS
ncbi:hypothetical protein AB6A40_010274 [Gnathostoma spinigerum]|uniref:Uncharacterized protein n=1 Tax=Gnathostoma spinigerum TaxID=75299 RepID=A0ABD6F317_9BILA